VAVAAASAGSTFTPRLATMMVARKLRRQSPKGGRPRRPQFQQTDLFSVVGAVRVGVAKPNALAAEGGWNLDDKHVCLAGRHLTKRSAKSRSERQQRIKAHRNKATICARKDRSDDEAGSVKGHAPYSGSL